MHALKTFKEIQAYCQAHQDPERVAKYARYFKEGYDAHGVSEALIREKIAEIIAAHQPSFEELWPLCRLLVPQPKYEEPSFAILLFDSFKKHYSSASFAEIAAWFDLGINNWAHCDGVCMLLVKPHLLRGFAQPEDLLTWRSSTRPFKRRGGPVSLIYYLKNGGDPQFLLDYVRPLMQDSERVVQQGVGWMLRETWKKQAGITEDFLLEWKNISPRLIFQYATEKMSKEEKGRFRKEQ